MALKALTLARLLAAGALIAGPSRIINPPELHVSVGIYFAGLSLLLLLCNAGIVLYIMLLCGGAKGSLRV